MIRLTENLSRDEQRVGELLDAGKLACTRCEQRAATMIVGVYADVALCDPCDGKRSPAEAEYNGGEFPVYGSEF